MKKMGVDLGQVRIGIALSEALNIFAYALETYKRKSLNEDLEYLAKIANENEVDTIVFGLPLNMDGTQGEKCQETYEFVENLKKYCNQKIVFQDERLTTVSAEKMLIDANVSRQGRKQNCSHIYSAKLFGQKKFIGVYYGKKCD